MAVAQRGSGKTAAFTLPMLQRLMGVRSEFSRSVRALVMVPTREVAAQVARRVLTYGAHMPFHCASVVSGIDMAPQVEAPRRGADIVVATPRRLLEHAGKGNIDFSQVGIVVLDDVDRILDLGGYHDVRRALALMPARRQSLLFSATFPGVVNALAGQLLEDPELIEAELLDGRPTEIGHGGYQRDREGKTELQAELAQRGARSGVLVFPAPVRGEPPRVEAGLHRRHRRRSSRRQQPIDRWRPSARAHGPEGLSR